MSVDNQDVVKNDTELPELSRTANGDDDDDDDRVLPSLVEDEVDYDDMNTDEETSLFDANMAVEGEDTAHVS